MIEATAPEFIVPASTPGSTSRIGPRRFPPGWPARTGGTDTVWHTRLPSAICEELDL